MEDWVLARIFSALVKWRWFLVVLYALVVPPAGYFAARVTQDNSIERLIVPNDPDYERTRDFQKVFGAGEYAILVVEAENPFDPGVVSRFDAAEKALLGTPNVEINSALSIFRRAKAGFGGTPEELAAFQKFATSSDLLRKQGLVGDHFLAAALVMTVEGAAGRRDTVAAVDKAILPLETDPGPVTAVRRVGQPYVSTYLDETTQRTANRLFAVFMAFVIALTLLLYRSLRTLIAFLLTLAASVALSLGYIGVTGGQLSIVSPMVPMTILVTATATLVYLQSHFVDKPQDRTVDKHQVLSLSNKFLACTASLFAAIVGFAALAVSDIRPIREMGIWVAVGLTITWVVVLTLFPALQKILKTPTNELQKTAAPWFDALAEQLPLFSYKYRWALVSVSVLLSAGGAVALFGLPGVVEPMRLLTNPIAYISPNSKIYEDYNKLLPVLPGMSITNVWVKATDKGASVSDPEVLTALNDFQTALEGSADIGAAIGPPTILRIMRHTAGGSDQWPTEPEARDEMANDLESLLPHEPTIQKFVDRGASQAQLAIVSKATEHEGFLKVETLLKETWAKTVEKNKALGKFEMSIVGLAPLQAKMSQNLVPTLVESFGLTVAIIFVTFLVVFRSGAARVMAMIPSLAAILLMFGAMRVSGMSLNVATILIASTVLGSSENDQIHFFYHFQEKRKDGTPHEALRHTFRVAGKAIFFATIINAGGFLAFALADLPPMRHFGILTALAFTLSMIADFTALPAALWIVFRAKPDPVKAEEAKSAPRPRRRSSA